MVLVRDIIFNEDKIWNKESLQYIANIIKKMDDAIKIVQVSELEVEDIQPGEDIEEDVESASAISYQKNHKAEDLDADVNVEKVEVKDNDFVWAENQYPNPNLLVFKVFLTNLVGLPVENVDSFKFKGMDCNYKKSFIASMAKKRSKYCALEPTVITQLEKQ